MKHGLAIGVALLLCAAAQAADPPQSRRPAQSAAAAPAKPAATRPAVKKTLDLKIGDVRKYMTPKDYLAPINAPDAGADIVVEGERAAPRLKSELPVPGGLGSLWYAASNPLQSWRILLPDVNARAAEPVYDVVPPPVFRWGP
jgi:hypothetical protein